MKKEIQKNKIHRLRFAAKNKETWDFIKSGKKKVETRAGTIKYQRVQKGDTLVLCCGKSHLEKKVKKVRHFKALDSILRAYKYSQINPGIKSKQEMVDRWYSFPGYKEKIKEFGILAFELE
ncbi:MAG: ASCH domain-containing protein [Patescibacteria group bacterium]